MKYRMYDRVVVLVDGKKETGTVTDLDLGFNLVTVSPDGVTDISGLYHEREILEKLFSMKVGDPMLAGDTDILVRVKSFERNDVGQIFVKVVREDNPDCRATVKIRDLRPVAEGGVVSFTGVTEVYGAWIREAAKEAVKDVARGLAEAAVRRAVGGVLHKDDLCVSLNGSEISCVKVETLMDMCRLYEQVYGEAKCLDSIGPKAVKVGQNRQLRSFLKKNRT